MNQDILLKVYGHIYPVDAEEYAALTAACAGAMPTTDDVPVLELDGDMARISFEGCYFPVDEVLVAIRARLRPQQCGKLDVLNLDAWRLTRHTFEGGAIHSHSAPLNNVLDYSGF